MTRPFLARAALVAALIFAQAAVAAHGLEHFEISPADCPLCLSNSVSNGALPGEPYVVSLPPVRRAYPVAAPVAELHPGKYQGYNERAPPLFR